MFLRKKRIQEVNGGRLGGCVLRRGVAINTCFAGVDAACAFGMVDLESP